MQSEKKTVVHLNDIYLPITESWIYNQVNRLKRYKPVFIAHRIQNKDLFPLSDVYSLPKLYYYANIINLRLFGTHIPFYHKKIIKKHKAELLHAHFGPEGVRNLNIKTSLNLPMITTFYGYDVSTLPKHKYWMKKYKILFQIGDLFLTEGTNMKNELIKLGCPEEKIIVQHIGVDIDKFMFKPRKPEDDGKINILMAATFKEKKGIPYGIKAFSNIKKKYNNVFLKVIGDGKMRKDIELLIEELNLKNSITLSGYQPHEIFLQELYNSHIFLAPSVTAKNGDTEGGAPVSILEAQATGIPVVSSYHADIPEVVVNGKGALLAEERDIDGLVKHLEYLIEHPDIWERMGMVGREHVKTHYNLSIQIEKLENIYDTLLSQDVNLKPS